MTCSTGAGPCVYIIKRGVLLIIIPNEHVETITGMFHLCNKFLYKVFFMSALRSVSNFNFLAFLFVIRFNREVANKKIKRKSYHMISKGVLIFLSEQTDKYLSHNFILYLSSSKLRSNKSFPSCDSIVWPLQWDNFIAH